MDGFYERINEYHDSNKGKSHLLKVVAAQDKFKSMLSDEAWQEYLALEAIMTESETDFGEWMYRKGESSNRGMALIG